MSARTSDSEGLPTAPIEVRDFASGAPSPKTIMPEYGFDKNEKTQTDQLGPTGKPTGKRKPGMSARRLFHRVTFVSILKAP
jgi:hypothetical protein